MANPAQKITATETERAETHSLASAQRHIPLPDAADYHQHLLHQIQQHPPILRPVNGDTPALMPFNGYYPLDCAPGAFFAVDTNMIMAPGNTKPVHDLTLIICLDGHTANRYAFTGTFNGATLKQTWETSGLSILLTFDRTSNDYGTVASCTGTISLNGEPATRVTGSTYNNPIPATLYTGVYYAHTGDDKEVVKAMSIGADNQLYYDQGKGDGQLHQVKAYVYNMNMYYFSFMDGDTDVKLIMGTAGNKGFACNNMSINNGQSSARSLLTIPNAPELKPPLYDLGSTQLADFSGYYSLSNASSPLAFVSIQAQYATFYPGTQWDLTYVLITVSMNGTDSQAYYFDPFTMQFDNDILDMPKQNIRLQLKRQYDPLKGSLVSLTGHINKQTITGYNLFNPVPLCSFEGTTMTNDQGDSLKVDSNNSVTYNNQLLNDIIYVPLMYILAAPASKPEIVMSFGTDGTHGNACIVTTDAQSKQSKTTAVWAIPGHPG